MKLRQPPVLLTALWVVLYSVGALLMAWSRNGSLLHLVLAGAAWLVAMLLYAGVRGHIANRATLLAAAVFLLIGLVGAASVAVQLQRLSIDWDRLRAARDAQTRVELDRRLTALIAQGEAAAEAAALSETASQDELFRNLDQLLQRTRVDALVIYRDVGETRSAELRAWAGEHRGSIPPDVLTSSRSVHFVERPLYSYMYFTHSTGRGRAVAALLLDAALPAETDEQLVERIDLDQDLLFQPGPGTTADWNVVIGDDTLLHARVEPITQADWRHELLRVGQRFEAIAVLVAVLLLAVGWFREISRPARLPALVPLLGTLGVVAIAPLGTILGLERLFSPGLFLLPGVDMSLGTLLALLLVCSLFISTVRLRGGLRGALLFLPAAVILAIAYPLAIQYLIGPAATTWDEFRAATPSLLQGGAALWAGLQFALVLLLGLATALVIAIARWPKRSARMSLQRSALFLIVGSSVLAGAISLAMLAYGTTRQHVSPWYSTLWIAPVLLAGFGTAAYQRDGRGLIRWLLSGWIAATLVMPYLWNAEVNTRLRSAERELGTLGNRLDPFLDFLLRQFGREAIARRESGEDDLQLLYRTWVSSGLAQAAYPARITIWDANGNAEVQLPLGDALSSVSRRVPSLPQYLLDIFVRVQDGLDPQVFTAHEVEDVNQILLVPLDRGRRLTVEVPPRRSFERASVIAPLLGTRADLSTSLELVPARASAGSGIWRRTQESWRSEARVQFPDGVYHAHLQLRLPREFVQIARGVLIVATDLLALLLLWALGRAIRGEGVRPERGWFGWLRTFRGRVTAALFLFFLIPTVVFGWVAYGALAREVERAARIVAERAVLQSVIEFQSNIDLQHISAHAGAEVLLYFQGELQSVSSPEALGLGVYNAWMPRLVFLTLERGDEEAAWTRRRIGNQDFLTAYRRLQVAGTGTMAIPVSLESHETVLRQREMAHLILFAALMGGLLSLALSLAVGRTLAGPIGRLQRAAAMVGGGRLNVQLPEQTGDEFGQVFASFNRMVRRLRRARTQEVRSARVLAWGEMARQVAHEIKNPLTPIKLAVQHLKRAYGDRRPNFQHILDQSVDQILVEIDRLSDIARAFSRYGAPAESAGPLERVLIPNVVNEALTLYRAGDPQLEYVDQIEPGLPPVQARAGELKEVILNLLDNARAATEPGGRVAVIANRNEDVIELCVEDTGVGMPDEMLTKIFEPHFSTRSTGTGLGLAIVRRLVESWGGTVAAESKTGRGTTIRVRLVIAALPD